VLRIGWLGGRLDGGVGGCCVFTYLVIEGHRLKLRPRDESILRLAEGLSVVCWRVGVCVEGKGVLLYHGPSRLTQPPAAMCTPDCHGEGLKKSQALAY
jgi:hypothetical protein